MVVNAEEVEGWRREDERVSGRFRSRLGLSEQHAVGASGPLASFSGLLDLLKQGCVVLGSLLAGPQGHVRSWCAAAIVCDWLLGVTHHHDQP